MLINYPTRIEKVIINSSIKGATLNKKLLDNMITCFKQITGQNPIINKAKNSVFKIREGEQIGCRVTLRKQNLKNFIFNFVNIFIPLIKEFNGFSVKSFDKNSNYNIGIKDLSIFPQIDYNLITRNNGLQITFVFSSKRIEENKIFLNLMDFPFIKNR
jgi:large subunit ribosomal protein L5